MTEHKSEQIMGKVNRPRKSVAALPPVQCEHRHLTVRACLSLCLGVWLVPVTGDRKSKVPSIACALSFTVHSMKKMMLVLPRSTNLPRTTKLVCGDEPKIQQRPPEACAHASEEGGLLGQNRINVRPPSGNQKSEDKNPACNSMNPMGG